MTYDVAQLRRHFPSLESGIAHFDGPGGTQTPREVGEAIAATLTGPLSSRGTGSLPERNADDAVHAFRQAYGDLLGVPECCTVFGRSATQLTYDFSRTLARTWKPGDEIVLSLLDHDCNVRPWVQAAERVGARMRWIDFDPATGEVDMDSVSDAIGERTRLVAITAASNLIGTKPPVREIADRAHAVGALTFIDGVHYTAHGLVDMRALGADFFVCSPYKFLGPHCAVLAGSSPHLLEDLHPDKLAPSTDQVPERFELGTLPYEILSGATAAVDFIAAIDPGDGQTRRARLHNSWDAIHAHEARLLASLEAGLADLAPEVEIHSRAQSRTPTLLLTLRNRSTRDAYEFLSTRKVLAPAGSFYAYEPFRRLELDDDGGLRLGLAPYSTEDDIGRVLNGLADFLAVGQLRTGGASRTHVMRRYGL